TARMATARAAAKAASITPGRSRSAAQVVGEPSPVIDGIVTAMPLARRVAPAGQAALLATAAAALGLAVHLRDGAYHPSALGLVGVALVCTLAVLLEVPVLRMSGR